jgi:hypothetical protein
LIKSVNVVFVAMDDDDGIIVGILEGSALETSHHKHNNFEREAGEIQKRDATSFGEYRRSNRQNKFNKKWRRRAIFWSLLCAHNRVRRVFCISK